MSRVPDLRGQIQVVAAHHVVMFEGVEQSGIAQRGRRPGLVPGSPIAVERHPDQFDLGDCPAPRVRTIGLTSMTRALSSLPVDNTARSLSMITSRT